MNRSFRYLIAIILSIAGVIIAVSMLIIDRREHERLLRFNGSDPSWSTLNSHDMLWIILAVLFTFAVLALFISSIRRADRIHLNKLAE
jgi:hypothetical protein